jgi:hypothetical protein
MRGGSSGRKGRSHSHVPKVGPSSRAHKRASVARRQEAHKAEGGRSMSDPLDLMVSEARPDGRRAS